ncbi:hypothetical protein KXV85_002874, partial [Aspergillus fumigatus]
LAACRLKISQMFGNRRHARQQQVLARSRAGDVKQPPLGFLDVVELCLVGRIGNAFIERQNTFVACQQSRCAKFQTLGEAHLRRHDSSRARQSIKANLQANETLTSNDALDVRNNGGDARQFADPVLRRDFPGRYSTDENAVAL